jgi:hypothetical protein
MTLIFFWIHFFHLFPHGRHLHRPESHPWMGSIKRKNGVQRNKKISASLKLIARALYKGLLNRIKILDEIKPSGLEHLTANAKVATVQGSIPASSNTVESERRR